MCQSEGRPESGSVWGEVRASGPQCSLGSVDATPCEPAALIFGSSCKPHGPESFLKMPVMGPHSGPWRCEPGVFFEVLQMILMACVG